MPLNLVSKRYMCVIHVIFVVNKIIFGLTNSPKPYKRTGTLNISFSANHPTTED